MSPREHLRHLLPHFEFKLLEALGEWLLHHLWGPTVLAVLVAIVQRVQGVPYDWWVLGILFFGSLGLMVYSHRRDRRQQVTVVPEIVSPPPVSPRDEANRGNIAVLFRAYGAPASGELQQIARKLLDHFRNFRTGENRSEGHEIIAQLVDNGPFVAWASASNRLSRVIEGQDKIDGSGLQHLLGNFFLAYQDLVRWVFRLDDFQLRVVAESKGLVTRFDSVLSGKEFISWQEKHKLFHQQFRELLAADDFGELRKHVNGNWSDTF